MAVASFAPPVTLDQHGLSSVPMAINRKRSLANIPARPEFSAEHYCSSSSKHPPRERGTRRRLRQRLSSYTDSSSTTDESIRSGSISPMSTDSKSNEIELPNIKKSLNDMPLEVGKVDPNDKKTYNSDQFREENEKLRHRIRHKKPSAEIVLSGPSSETTPSEGKVVTTETTDVDNTFTSKTTTSTGEPSVDVPVGATEQQSRLIQSKGFMEKEVAMRLDKKLNEKDDLISGLEECQLKSTPREKVISATKEVQNAVKPQIIRDPVTSLRSYKVNLHMGQFVNNVTHVVAVDKREVTVIGQTAEQPVFTKEMKVQFPVDVNMDTVNVVVQDEDVVVDVAFKKWRAKSSFIGHRDRVPQTAKSILNVFLGKGSLADAPIYKPKKKELLFSRGYGSTYRR